MPNVEYFSKKQREYTQARRHHRVPTDFMVHVRAENRLADHARDYCEGGIGVATTQPLAPMTLVSMRLELPHQVPVDVLGRVMWSGPGSMGIRFENNDKRIFESLDRTRREMERL
jgi:hypothetical protein